MSRRTSSPSRGPSQRQLRAGELIRHALAEMLQRDEVHDAALRGHTVTISEVKAAPDLRNATVYCTALGGQGTQDAVAALNKAAPRIQSVLGSKISTKFTPRLTFKADTSFDEAQKIETLLAEQPETDLGD